MSVLQIGDIHYPENADKILADVKDSGLPAITSMTIPNNLQVVFRGISRAIEKSDPAAILICGDLTSRGDISQYQSCVDYLIQSLDLHSRSQGSIHVVPGNHDVNRKLCTDRERVNLKKFEPLLQAWDTLSKDVLSTSGIRSEQFAANGCNLKIFSMNSCMGCGEWHLLPSELRNELGNLLDAARQADPDKAFDLEGDQLDTPMFDHGDIDELSQLLQDLPLDWMPIVLAHHNLLPQELVRIELYTELINSGQFRSSIASICRPIIYCHGHIHTDPIEIICDGTKSGSQLICISAPQITDGFNELIAHFSNDGKPLGLEIVTHRVRHSGTMIQSNRHRIPFDNRAGFLTEEMEKLQGCIGKEPKKFLDLKSNYDAVTQSKVQNATFAGLIQEAAWHGIASIDNEQHAPKQWHIRRRLA